MYKKSATFTIVILMFCVPFLVQNFLEDIESITNLIRLVLFSITFEIGLIFIYIWLDKNLENT